MGTRREFMVADEPVVVIAHPKHDKAALFREFIASAPDGVLGLDVETTAIEDGITPVFDPGAALRLVQLGTKHEAWCLDPHDPFWRNELWQLFELGSERFVSHTNYDPLWIRKEFGVNLGERSIDTHPMMCLLAPGAFQSHELKVWSTRHIDAQLADAEEELMARFKELAPTGQRVGKKLKQWGFTNIPLDDPIYTKYAGLDAIYVRRLLDIIAGMLRSKAERKLSRREQSVKRLMNDVTWRGHRVDIDYTMGILSEVEAEYGAADARLRETLGFTPGSPRVKGWLESRGVRFVSFTKTGQGKLDKEALEILAPMHEQDAETGPVLADLLTLSVNKNIRTNLRIIVNNVDDRDEIHPAINTMQALTGRMSITKPAMQTFKKGRLRGCFLAREGRTLVGADYDSQEIRLGIAYSGDELMTRVIKEGLSQHDETAKAMFGADFTPAQRQISKIYNFASQYGAGPRQLSRQLKIPLAEATEHWRNWRKAYAGLVGWSAEMAKLSMVVNPWGRRIPRDRFRPYANGNYMIQSSGRDVLGDALVTIAEMGRAEWIWLPVHDEIILEVPDDEDSIAEAKSVLEEAMYCTVLGTELTASAEHIGRRWGGEPKTAAAAA